MEQEKAQAVVGVDHRLAKAFSHPTRVQIMVELSDRVMSPREFSTLCKPTRPLSQVSYHFRELEKAGLIEIVKEVGRRGAVEHYYRITQRALFDDGAWSGLPKRVRASVTGTTFETLIGRVAEAMRADTIDTRPDSHLTWLSLKLDEQAWGELMEELMGVFERARDLEVEAEARMESSGEEPVPTTVALMGFESPALKPDPS